MCKQNKSCGRTGKATKTKPEYIDTYGIESDSSLVHQTDYAIDSTTLGNIVPTGSLLNTFGVALLAA